MATHRNTASLVAVLTLLLSVTGASETAGAEESTQELRTDDLVLKIDPVFQVRPRLEKSFAGPSGGIPRALPAMPGEKFIAVQRSRVGLKASAGPVQARLVVQDVRAWGEIASTALGAPNGLNIFEGWMQFGETVKVRAGRQTLNIDGQRLIGELDWAQQGRSFDGVSLMHQAGMMSGTAFWGRTPDLGNEHDLIVLNAAFDLAPIVLSVPVLIESNILYGDALRPVDGTPAMPAPRSDWTRFTGGVYAKGAAGALSWRAEAYVQAGKNQVAADMFAYMAAGRVGYKVNDVFSPALWVDFLSGDDDLADGTDGAFNPNYGTNHKFYGFIDRFLNIPLHTGSRGLVDLSLKNTSNLGPGSLHVAVHEFLLPTDNQSGKGGAVGMELDVTYTFVVSKFVNIQAGAALFVDQGTFKDAKDATNGDTLTDWSYLQLDVSAG